MWKLFVLERNTSYIQIVMVIILRNELDDLSSILGWGCLHWEKYVSNYPPSSYWQIVGQVGLFNLSVATSLREGKFWIQTSWTPLEKLILCHILFIEEWKDKYIIDIV